MKAKANTSPEILTLRQVAQLLHCHPSTLYRMASRGEVPSFRLGGSWRFQRDAIDEWIARRTIRSAG
jgi:excisionase family DNA binding protein